MKLAEDNPTDAPNNAKRLKEEKPIPSRSLSLDSNTLGMFGSCAIVPLNEVKLN